MYHNQFILCVIPARGGSKGIKNKNIKRLAGKPLLAWSIEHAKESKLIDRAIVSTDSKKIADVAKKFGGDVPFLRPKEFAQDTTPMYPVLQHAVAEIEQLENKKVDIILLLDPTSPTRFAADIDVCIKKCVDENFDTVITAFESDYNPYFNMIELDDKGQTRLVITPQKPIYRRQDAPKVYCIGSDIYAIKRATVMDDNLVIGKRTGAVIVPKEQTGGIDDLIVFKIKEAIIKRRVKATKTT
jgi:CMP-N-acetylneuraminic acid synthetase